MQWGGALDLFDVTTSSRIQVRTFGSFDGNVPDGAAAWLAPAILKAVEEATAAFATDGLATIDRKKDAIAQAALERIAPQLQQVGASGRISINAFSFSEDDLDRLQQAAIRAAQAKRMARAAPAATPAAIAPGANVLVQWSDGNRYPGVVREQRGDSFLVAFSNGTTSWIPAMYVSS